MRVTFTILLFFVLKTTCYSQLTKADYYNKIDNTIHTFNQGKTHSFDSIVSFVNHSFVTNEDKIRAYYSWIATNITYDLEYLANLMSFSKMKMRMATGISQNADTVFKKRKAVCEGFSVLLCKFCEASNIKSVMVGGYSKLPEGDVNTEMLHAWNAVRLDSSWKLIDVTWSGGFVNAMNQYVTRFSDKYFFTDPKEFVKDHLPLDAMWQLLEKPISKDQFFNSTDTTYYSTNFQYRDSIKNYLVLKGAEQKYADALHSHLFDPQNVDFVRDLDVYINNIAADYLLEASVHYKKFQDYQNQKMGKHPSTAMCKKAKALLELAKQDLVKTIDFLKTKKAYTDEYKTVFQEMTDNANSNLKNLKEIIDSINSYLKDISRK